MLYAWLERVEVAGFRNLTDGIVTFDPGANYLFGDNGAGKTNLLEAIFYLASGRSFRGVRDADLARIGTDFFRLVGSASGPGGRRQAAIGYEKGAKKAAIDGTECDRLSDYFGWLGVVTLILDDIALVRGGPGQRRSYLDWTIAKTSGSYLHDLGEYRQVLAQRNRLLGQAAPDRLFDAWEEQLADLGARLDRARRRSAADLLARAGQLSAEFLPGPRLEFTFVPSFGDDGDARAALRAALARLRPRERQLGFTLVGPHRDDIRIQRGGRDLRTFGSEGEQRIAAVSLRLAEALFIAGVRGLRPVFLLDEIASELDSERTAILFRLIPSDSQLFYAAARSFAASGRIFHVAQGTIRPA